MSFPVPNEYDIPDVKYNNGDVVTYPPSLSGDGTGVNLSQLEKDLILTLFSKTAYAEDDAGTAYDTLENLWTAPQKEVESITAAYTQSGTVYDTDSLDSLKADLVVTANYSGGTSETVPASDYTLSGTLTEGTSTITVSYAGLTDTFSVTVTEKELLPLNGLVGYWDFRNQDTALTSLPATKGTATLVRYDISSSDNYGAVAKSSFAFNSSGGTSYEKFPFPATFAGIAHNSKDAPCVWGNGGLLTNSNVDRFIAKPYYKTSSGSGSVTYNVPTDSTKNYTIVVVVLDSTSAKYFVDGVKVYEAKTADITDWASWSYVDSTYFTNYSRSNPITAFALWNRAVSESEAVDITEFMQSLEVV